MIQVVQYSLGLLAALAGGLAVVVGQRINPFYAQVASVHPSTRSLLSARDALAEGAGLAIADDQEELETVHQILIEEYDFYEQYTPIELSFFYNGFEVRYAEQRKQGRKNSPGIQDELVEEIDRRISKKLGRITLAATMICAAAFAGLLLSSLI